MPLGVALAAGITVALHVAPHWRAAGLPYMVGFGKNIEALAVAAALLAGASSRALAGRRNGRRLGGAIALAGYLLLALQASGPRIAAIAPQLLFVALVVGVMAAVGDGSTPGAGGPPGNPRLPELQRRLSLRADSIPAWAAAAGLLVLAALEFLGALEALSIDVFHHGEVLASAVDLIAGGRPFESFIWPHGLHDSGLAALFVEATGKVGTSPVALARAACAALGVVAAFVLGRALGLPRSHALGMAALLVTLPLLSGPAPANALPALSTLGILIFVVLGFAALRGRFAGAAAVAGALFALAHLFRFETGIFGAVAAAAALVDRHLPTGRVDFRDRLRPLAVDAASLLAGFVLVLLLCRGLFGWPGRAWFEYIFLELARHHRDAVGGVLSWPASGTSNAPDGEALTSAALAWLLLVLGLLVAAVRAALDRPRGGLAEARRRPRESPLTFVAVFALLATRSALDRVDAQHVAQWAVLPALALLLLAARSTAERRGWGALRTSAVAGIVLLFVDIGRPAAVWPAPRSPAETARLLRGQARLVGEHWAPNPALGDCHDASFTPTEAHLAENRRFLVATCEVERLLARHGVTDLAIAHSAPWYWVRFGMRPPTRYFALARAYTPGTQGELIRDLRSRAPQALLRPRGFGALFDFDLPDAVRVPVVEAFLRARRGGVRATVTPIGELFFWNEPDTVAGGIPTGPTAPRPPGAEAPTSRVRLKVEQITFQPTSGLLFARGTASDAARRTALARLHLARKGEPLAEIEYGLLRPTARDLQGGAPRAPVGWELFLQLPEAAGMELVPRGAPPVLSAPSITAQLSDGSVVDVALDLTRIRILGPLAGEDWRGLRAAVATAAELGRRDREAARSNPPAEAPRVASGVGLDRESD